MEWKSHKPQKHQKALKSLKFEQKIFFDSLDLVVLLSTVMSTDNRKKFLFEFGLGTTKIVFFEGFYGYLVGFWYLLASKF